MTTNATRQLKSTISKLFHFCGYDIVSHQKPGKDATPDNKIPEKPFNLLEIVIRDHITREPDFYFVEIGANDGVNFDPLRPLVLEHHLRGLLVEPLPDRFASLQSNYRSETQLSFEKLCHLRRRWRTNVVQISARRASRGMDAFVGEF